VTPRDGDVPSRGVFVYPVATTGGWSTGEFYRREAFYDSESIRVGQRGGLLG